MPIFQEKSEIESLKQVSKFDESFWEQVQVYNPTTAMGDCFEARVYRWFSRDELGNVVPMTHPLSWRKIALDDIASLDPCDFKAPSLADCDLWQGFVVTLTGGETYSTGLIDPELSPDNYEFFSEYIDREGWGMA